jgi:hypothetical protein
MDIEKRESPPSSAVNPPLIVAVACFAGDIAAPSELVSALPGDCGVAFIFVQQLSGGRDTETRLAVSLTGRATLPVIPVHGEVMVERGRLYVIPPNATPTMTGSRICVTRSAGGIDCSADTLFTSLAQEFGHDAIGVILSGGGSERALGIQAIKRAGGITFAQYPGSARFPNTPISAIETGSVDFVLRPNEIAHQLARISRQKETAARAAFRHIQITPPEPILTRPARDGGLLHTAAAPVAKALTTLLCTVFLTTGVGCKSTLTHEESVDDGAITTEVKTAIFNESGLKDSGIRVHTFEGVVQLSGFVSSRDDIKDAVRVAMAVSGVKAVGDEMQLR